MKRIIILAFLLSVFYSVTPLKADMYTVYSQLPVSSSNQILTLMQDAFRDDDYDLFEVMAKRTIELNIEAALPIFEELYYITEPDANECNIEQQTTYTPYFYLCLLGLGYFGGDEEATLLLNALIRNDDDFITFYIIKGLGYMTDSEVALGTLNQTAEWISKPYLARELLQSLEKHNSPSSINALLTMYYNPSLSSIRTEINSTISYIAAGGIQ